jgi:hypothetical protein
MGCVLRCAVTGSLLVLGSSSKTLFSSTRMNRLYPNLLSEPTCGFFVPGGLAKRRDIPAIHVLLFVRSPLVKLNSRSELAPLIQRIEIFSKHFESVIWQGFYCILLRITPNSCFELLLPRCIAIELGSSFSSWAHARSRRGQNLCSSTVQWS